VTLPFLAADLVVRSDLVRRVPLLACPAVLSENAVRLETGAHKPALRAALQVDVHLPR